MNAQYRHRDVLLEARPIPTTARAKASSSGRVVLAYGEVTCHAHAFYSNRVRFFRETGSDGVTRAFIRVEGPDAVPLQHEEHAAIPVPPGDYEVIRQREYTPSEIRQVAD